MKYTKGDFMGQQLQFELILHLQEQILVQKVEKATRVFELLEDRKEQEGNLKHSQSFVICNNDTGPSSHRSQAMKF